MFLTLAILALIICLPFMLTFWANLTQQNLWRGLFLSPGFAVLSSFRRTSYWPANAYWLSLAWTWLSAFLFLTVASIKIPNSWEESKPVRKGFNLLSIGQTKRRTVIRSNPFEWLAMQGETKGHNVWFLVGALFGLWSIGLLAQGRLLFEEGAVVVMQLLINGFFKFWIAGESSRRFMEDRRNNAFELLLSTPLDETKIINGQWWALLKQFGWPILFTVLWEISMLIGQAHYSWQHENSALHWELGLLFFFGLDLVTLSWLGMWLGIKLKTRALAITIALSVVLLLPWLLSYAAFTFLFQGSTGSRDEADILKDCEMFLALILDLNVIFWARRKLTKNFRRLVTEGHGRRGE